MQDLITQLRNNSKPNGEDISHYIRKPGTQLGSNPGGVFRDPVSGDDHYVKFYNNPEQARSEVAASKIYQAVGAHTVNPRLINHKGTLGVATKWQSLTHLGPEGYHSEGETYHDQNPDELAKHFHAAILTKNWDTVGLEHDNLKKDSNGNLVTVDTGGSFKFRAMGGPKEYGPDVAERESLVSGQNHQSKQAFSHLNSENLQKHKEVLQSLSPDKVHQIFKEVGVDSPEEHTANLLSRRDKLVERL